VSYDGSNQRQYSKECLCLADGRLSSSNTLERSLALASGEGSTPGGNVGIWLGLGGIEPLDAGGVESLAGRGWTGLEELPPPRLCPLFLKSAVGSRGGGGSEEEEAEERSTEEFGDSW